MKHVPPQYPPHSIGPMQRFTDAMLPPTATTASPACSHLLPPAWQALMRRLYPPGMGPLTDIPRTGPAPVMARPAEWLRVAPRWEGLSAQVRLTDWLLAVAPVLADLLFTPI